MPVIYGLNSLLRELSDVLSENGKAQVAGVSGAFTQLSLLALLRNLSSKTPGAQRNLIVVLPKSKNLMRWVQFFEHNIAYLNTNVTASLLPYYGGWGNDRFVNQNSSRNQRLYSLSCIADPSRTNVVVTTLQALGQTTLSPEEFQSSSLRLSSEQEYDLDVLTSSLSDLGYVEVQNVDEEGTFAIRGGIIDVFPVNSKNPVRIEFFGDEISSIRHFSVDTQRSKSSVKTIVIRPSVEANVPLDMRKTQIQILYNHLLDQGVDASDREGMIDVFRSGVRFSSFDMFAPLFRVSPDLCPASAFDYFGNDSLLIFPKAVEPCLDSYSDFLDECKSSKDEDLEKGRPCLGVNKHFVSNDFMSNSIEAINQLEFGNPHARTPLSFIRMEGRSVVQGAPIPNVESPDLFDKWLDVIRSVLNKEVGKVVILAHYDEQLERLNNLLTHRGFIPVVDGDLLKRVCKGDLEAGNIYLGKGDLGSHIWLDESELLILPEAAIFGPRKRKPKPDSKKLQNYLSSFKDLGFGDLVVHVQHGIGKYCGMKEIDAVGMTGDFLVLEYHGGDKVYLPVDRLSMLQKYAASDGARSRSLDKLGGQTWDKRKSRVKGAVRDMAEELLKQHAKRSMASAFRYPKIDDSYIKFEASFPFEETEDQLRALGDVEEDLCSDKAMDRLICGDVGFGKTEIALRAAYRAVLQGFQVLVLVPTTVLCYQHYKTFCSRLAEFGVKVAQVNRFVKAKAMKEALADLESGNIDILVGTHRILSKDIRPKNLGLFVIDEEQRFGVAHKEKLKKLAAGADILTLTATPIPRTLHMSMLGLRDISIIATPPQDRLSVKTYVAKFDETLVRDAISQEIARGGQVFVVHNRVEDIEEVTSFVRSLIPNVEVRNAHGQMREHMLETQIVDFLEQKYPVLVCTTIIESGIDMPNVNTMIVNRADRFGLSQLYQLRGRVGRSNRQAYAYFLTPKDERLSDDSKKRLEVIAAYQDLGSGFQIASHDLEIRGAGNLIGGEQSGHVSEVGLELYTELLEVAIAELRGEKVRVKSDAELKIPVSAVIPEAFIKNQNQRLHLYKTLFSAETQTELIEFKQEVEDRYGRLPDEFDRLMKIARLKQTLRSCRVTKLSVGAKHYLEMRFAALEDDEVVSILKVINDHPKKYKLAPNNCLYLFVDVPRDPGPEDQVSFITELLSLIDPLVDALNP